MTAVAKNPDAQKEMIENGFIKKGKNWTYDQQAVELKKLKIHLEDRLKILSKEIILPEATQATFQQKAQFLIEQFYAQKEKFIQGLEKTLKA